MVLAVVGIGALYWFEHELAPMRPLLANSAPSASSDGSTLELNAHSKVRVTLREHERDVELIDGQAMFRVAKDHSRPFIVHSGESEVRAVGTQFDVNRHRSGTTITVIEGRVAVFSAAQANGAGPALHAAARQTPSSGPALSSGYRGQHAAGT